jgi:hypothetical protein
MTFLDNRAQAALPRQPITPGKVMPGLYSLIYMIYLLILIIWLASSLKMLQQKRVQFSIGVR